MRRYRRHTHSICAILALSGAACGGQGITIVEPGPPSLAIAGVVTSQTGTPIAGATVHTQAYEPDCRTPVMVERDTLLIADANGAFHGLLRALDTGAVCLRVFSSIDARLGAPQLIQGKFLIASAELGQVLDTATVYLTIP